MSPVVPVKEGPGPVDEKATSVRLPKGMVEEIDEIATATNRSRNGTIALLLRIGIDAHWKGAGKRPKK